MTTSTPISPWTYYDLRGSNKWLVCQDCERRGQEMFIKHMTLSKNGNSSAIEARISELKCKLSDAEKEAEEQARLLGMSAERETGFLARAEEAERLAVKLEDALDRIDHELGRPDGLKIPAPVYNASHIAREALAECVLWRKSRE